MVRFETLPYQHRIAILSGWGYVPIKLCKTWKRLRYILGLKRTHSSDLWHDFSLPPPRTLFNSGFTPLRTSSTTWWATDFKSSVIAVQPLVQNNNNTQPPFFPRKIRVLDARAVSKKRCLRVLAGWNTVEMYLIH